MDAQADQGRSPSPNPQLSTTAHTAVIPGHRPSGEAPGAAAAPPTALQTKPCTKCGETKPLEEFHRDRTAKDGRQPRCKPCQCAAVRESNHRRKTREKRRRALLTAPRPSATSARPKARRKGQRPVVMKSSAGVDEATIAPLSIVDPIEVVTSCPAHGQISHERHDSQGDPQLTAGVLRRMDEAFHHGDGCDVPVTVSWKRVDGRRSTTPEVVQLHQPTVAGSVIA